MNRRGFLETMLKGAAAFTILPPATTYGRIWRVQRPELDLDEMFDAIYKIKIRRASEGTVENMVYTVRLFKPGSFTPSYASHAR